MVSAQPQFLLFCDTHLTQRSLESLRGTNQRAQGLGRWQFVLERLDGPERLEAADSESEIHADRLALLSVVRGLEALEQPSSVNLVTTSRYVSRGLKYGLATWREADYQWERFGERKPIRNADLWQRVDRALNYHGVTCRLIQPNVNTMGAIAASPSATNKSDQLCTSNAVLTAEPCGDRSSHQSTLEKAAPLIATSQPTHPVHSERRLPWEILQEWRVTKNWWELALSWIRWWRRRWQTTPTLTPAMNSPQYFGTQGC